MMKWLSRIVFVLWILWSFLISGKVYADIPSDLAVRAIVGEAASEGFLSMKAHAHALHNRGSLSGVYGLGATHVASEPESTWNQVKRAWMEALKEPDFTKGATTWLSDYDLKHCKRVYSKWIWQYEETIKVNHTHFYRKKNQ